MQLSTQTEAFVENLILLISHYLINQWSINVRLDALESYWLELHFCQNQNMRLNKWYNLYTYTVLNSIELEY